MEVEILRVAQDEMPLRVVGTVIPGDARNLLSFKGIDKSDPSSLRSSG
jgi:hypothetical protein